MRRVLSSLASILRIVGPVALLLVIVTHRSAIGESLRHAVDVGALFLCLFPLFALWNFVAAWGWRSVIRAVTQRGRLSVGRLSVIRVVSQSVNMVLPLSVGAPVLKVSFLTDRGVPVGKGAASVALDTVAATAVSLIFSLVVLSLYRASPPGGAHAADVLLVMTTILVAALAAIFFSPTNRLASWIRETRRGTILGWALAQFETVGPGLRRPFSVCLLSHVAEQALMACEIWIIALGLGVDVGIGHVAFSAAVMNGFTLVFFFMPGQVGAAEGGLAVAFSMLGLPPTVGLSIALVRRARQIVVYGIGLLVLTYTNRWSGIRALGAPFRGAASPRTPANRGGNDNAHFIPSTR